MPSKVEELFGIVIDIPNSELKMSHKRQIEISHDLKKIFHGKVTTKKTKLLSLIGKLSYITIVVRSGLTFIRRLISLAKSVIHLQFKVKINIQARWIQDLTKHNGECMLMLPWVTTSTTELLWSDVRVILKPVPHLVTNVYAFHSRVINAHIEQFPIVWHK